MSKLEEIAAKVDALTRRMDARVKTRADAGKAKTGTIRSEWTHHYNHKYGNGDFDYIITITYSIDVNGEPSKIKLVGENEMSPEERISALNAAEKSVRRYLDSSAGMQVMIEAVVERL